MATQFSWAMRKATKFGTVLFLLSACGSEALNTKYAPNSRLQNINASLAPANCDIVINGGSTAALAAALAAASSVGSPRETEKPEDPSTNPRPRTKAQVCLLEPTNWPGGQLTSQALSAIDFPWHKFQREMRSVHNQNNVFFKMLTSGNVLEGANPGGCWVSAYCTLPTTFLQKIEKLIASHSNLHVYLNTVVKQVETDGKKISGLTAIRRTPKSGTGYSRTLSAALADWYSFSDSSYFSKERLTFKSTPGKFNIFIDASEFGDVLVLSGASYTQGIEKSKNEIRNTYDTCGQATVFPFLQTRDGGAAEETFPLPAKSAAFYNFKSNGKSYTSDRIWDYRQVASGPRRITMQNWNPGNDYPFGYIFQSKAKTNEERQNWAGGINLTSLAAAQSHALGWHQYWKNNATDGASVRLYKQGVGTFNGLAKIPYLRDIRRSIGIGGFFIQDQDILAPSGSIKAKQFADSLGLGLYAIDFHPLAGCPTPAHLFGDAEKTGPFTLPFLAHTNETYENLLVAGKAIAQTYYVNAATRLQPIEWSSGWGAGIAAANMWRFGASSLSVGLSYLPNPRQFKPPSEPESSFSQRLAKSNYLMKQIQFEIVDAQPLWFCNAVGRSSDCITTLGRFRLSMPPK